MKTYFRFTRFEAAGVLVDDRLRPLDALEAVLPEVPDLEMRGLGMCNDTRLCDLAIVFCAKCERHVNYAS